MFVRLSFLYVGPKQQFLCAATLIATGNNLPIQVLAIEGAESPQRARELALKRVATGYPVLSDLPIR